VTSKSGFTARALSTNRATDAAVAVVVGSRRVRKLERPDLHRVFARDPQKRPARDEEPDSRCGGEQRDERGCRADDLLEVVQHHQHPPVSKRRLQLLGDRAIARVEHSESFSDGVRHECRLLHGRQIDELDLASACLLATRDVDRQPALADSTRPDEGDEADGVALQERLHGGQFRRPPDQLREGCWGGRRGLEGDRPDVGSRLGPGAVESFGEQGRQIRLQQASQLLGRGEVLERRVVVVAHAVEELGEPRLARLGRFPDVDELGESASEVVLVLQPRDDLTRGDPAVPLGVQADEDVALAQVGAIQLARRVRARAEFEHDGREMEPLDGDSS
jgi:hypothetical protein